MPVFQMRGRVKPTSAKEHNDLKKKKSLVLLKAEAEVNKSQNRKTEQIKWYSKRFRKTNSSTQASA